MAEIVLELRRAVFLVQALTVSQPAHLRSSAVCLRTPARFPLRREMWDVVAVLDTRFTTVARVYQRTLLQITSRLFC